MATEADTEEESVKESQGWAEEVEETERDVELSLGNSKELRKRLVIDSIALRWGKHKLLVKNGCHEAPWMKYWSALNEGPDLLVCLLTHMVS